jgi:hypothetical protein
MAGVAGVAGSCSAVTCARTNPGGACVSWNNAERFVCDAADWQNHITTYPPKWWVNKSASELTPLEYLDQLRPCCKHCAWSLGYPLGLQQVMVISPNQDFCAGTTAGFSLCFLDCTKWPGDFSQLDADSNGYLNSTEFNPYFDDYFVAPSQNFKLYTGGGLAYDPVLSRLDPTVSPPPESTASPG